VKGEPGLMRAKGRTAQGDSREGAMQEVRNAAGLIVDDRDRVSSESIAAPSLIRIFSSSNEAGYSTVPGCLQATPPNFRIRRLHYPNRGRRPLILVRSDDGKIRALMNTCRHRGTWSAGSTRAKARNFFGASITAGSTTPCDLKGVPGEDAYSDAFDRDALGLDRRPECTTIADASLSALIRRSRASKISWARHLPFSTTPLTLETWSSFRGI